MSEPGLPNLRGIPFAEFGSEGELVRTPDLDPDPAEIKMSPGILLFTGAPESKSLDWKQDDLLDAFSEPFSRFAQLGNPQELTTPDGTEHPAWRSLPLSRQHLPTGLSQNHGWQKEYQGASFFTTDSFIEELSQPALSDSQASVQSLEQVLSQFYEQSYAIHEDIASSQIAIASDAGTSVNSASSFGASTFDSPWNSFSGEKVIPVGGHLTNLEDIPNAGYLSSIHPQTMTVNLIIGIISMPSPRAIRTRRGADVELVEVLAGDDSRSGFGINFWLSPSQSIDGDLRGILGGLRPQDVVLMKNVALSSFRGKVYGQSLRKGMTKVYLLYRNRIDKTDEGGCYNAADLATGDYVHPQIDKTRRVREWVLKFVGGLAGQKKGEGKNSEALNETLPPDTQ